MASQHDTFASDFAVTSLRSDDAAYLGGSVLPRFMPNPVALATGPAGAGPAGGAVGANEMWSAAITVPDQEVLWVLVSCNLRMLAKTTVVPASVYFEPHNGSGTLLGLGSSLSAISPAYSAGTYVDQVAAAVPKSTFPWVPVHPSVSSGGFTSRLFVQAGAGGLAQNDLYVYMEGIRFLGFPLTAWNAAMLWEPTTRKGS